jgi:hypothetical protein
VAGIDIFLSYSREDRAAVRHIAESFTAEGFDVWWDAALQSGQTFDEVIEQRLKEAKAVVVLWSPRSVTSRWVRAEATLADRKNKLVPAIIEPCDRPIAFELTHTADLSEWTGERTDPKWLAFVNDVEALVHRRSKEEQSEAPALSPRPRAAFHRPQRTVTPAPPPREHETARDDDVIFASSSRHAPEPPEDLPVPDEQAYGIPDNDEVHCLQVIDGFESDHPLVVGPSGLKIGRTPPADAVISHPSVSREHCVIGVANDELLVSDLNSTNGTYIDDVRVSRPALLPVGSVLRIGEVTLRHEVHPRSEVLQGASAARRGGHRPARFATAP